MLKKTKEELLQDLNSRKDSDYPEIFLDKDSTYVVEINEGGGGGQGGIPPLDDEENKEPIETDNHVIDLSDPNEDETDGGIEITPKGGVEKINKPKPKPKQGPGPGGTPIPHGPGGDPSDGEEDGDGDGPGGNPVDPNDDEKHGKGGEGGEELKPTPSNPDDDNWELPQSVIDALVKKCEERDRIIDTIDNESQAAESEKISDEVTNKAVDFTAKHKANQEARKLRKDNEARSWGGSSGMGSYDFNWVWTKIHGKSKLKWKEILKENLRRSLTALIKAEMKRSPDYSVLDKRKRNRLQIAKGLVPTFGKKISMHCWVDVSGSVSTRDFQVLVRELKGIFLQLVKEFEVEIFIVYWDDVVYNIEKIGSRDSEKLESILQRRNGSGGNNFSVVRKALELKESNKERSPKLVLHFSDLQWPCTVEDFIPGSSNIALILPNWNKEMVTNFIHQCPGLTNTIYLSYSDARPRVVKPEDALKMKD